MVLKNETSTKDPEVAALGLAETSLSELQIAVSSLFSVGANSPAHRGSCICAPDLHLVCT